MTGYKSIQPELDFDAVPWHNTTSLREVDVNARRIKSKGDRERVIEAFNKCKEPMNWSNVEAVIAGMGGWINESSCRRVLHHLKKDGTIEETGIQTLSKYGAAAMTYKLKTWK